MSIATAITAAQNKVAAAYTSCNNMGATMPAVSDQDLSHLPATIESIPQGSGAPAPENDVNFYDYDGTRVASYTIAEAKALAALPSAPSHTGLTFQSWNWTLADIQSYDRQYIDVGANYITTDGKTHIKARVDFVDVNLTMRGHKCSVSIDWGDGSAADSYNYPGYNVNHSFAHTYAAEGIYDIAITITQTNEGGKCGFQNLETPTASGWYGFTIIELNIGNNLDFYDKGNFQGLNGAAAPISVPALTTLSALLCNYMLTPAFVVPRSSAFVFPYLFAAQNTGRIILPRSVKNAGGQNYLFYQAIIDRVVMPEWTDATTYNADAFNGSPRISILSLPSTASFAGAATINSSYLQYIDIAQNWTPNQNLNLSQSTRWSAQAMVKFFNKLGTTSGITLTFGSTNLGKLSAAEKAIATDKGYTLA